ncbi:uncharacterized protein LOC121377753 [Gigantopelta aegis]|uniref:uncharacterized protein LOC121377753 n=1 Tax=Gigantopelta aegis TaxID=1735272 RepID=UPI001B88A3FE|nr:uncharacterized protein LOC121377753 [Gigantopelta aegis]
MNALCFFVALAGVIQTIRGETCTVCETNYETAKSAAADAAAKCAAFRAFVTCFASSSGDGCDPPFDIFNKVFNAKVALSSASTCLLDYMCEKCQFYFRNSALSWTSSTKYTEKCAAVFRYASCVEMRPTTEKACDGTTDQAAMKSRSLAKVKAECPWAGATAVKSSVVIMVSALFCSSFDSHLLVTVSQVLH